VNEQTGGTEFGLEVDELPAPVEQPAVSVQPSAPLDLTPIPETPSPIFETPPSPAVRGEAAMETRTLAPLGLQRDPAVNPELADAIAALRAGYNPEVDPSAPETSAPAPKPAAARESIESAVADLNWRGSVRQAKFKGDDVFVPVDASGRDVTVGGKTILGKTPREAIEMAQRNVIQPAAPEAAAPKPVAKQSSSTETWKEFQELNLRRQQAQNKVKGVKFTKADEARFKELFVKHRSDLFYEVDPKTDELLGKNERGEPIYWSATAKTHYALDATGKVRTAPWIEGLPEQAIDRLHSLYEPGGSGPIPQTPSPAATPAPSPTSAPQTKPAPAAPTLPPSPPASWTGDERKAYERAVNALRILREYAPGQIRRASQAGKRKVERAALDLQDAAEKIGISVPRRTTFFNPEADLQTAEQFEKALLEIVGHPAAPVSQTPSPAHGREADAADRSVTSALSGGVSANPFLDPKFWQAVAVSGARILRELGQFTASFARWSAAMVRKFGSKIQRALASTWTRLMRAQHAQANGVSANGQAHLNQIEALAGVANIPLEQHPPYDDATLAKGAPGLLTRAAPVSAQVATLGSAELAAEQRKLQVSEATQAAAVKRQSDDLWRKLVESAAPSTVLGRFALPKWLVGSPRARAFKRRALHIAARLNATGRDAQGNFVFQDFTMRAGGMSLGTAEQMGLQPGDQFQTTDPLTGVTEVLTLGPVVTTPEGRVFHQLARPVSAQTQREVYDHFAREFPEMMWFVDMFIDPALANVRQTVNGVQVPVFNRFASAAMMADGDPNFSPLTAYTPDVLVTRSLLGAIRGALSFRAGTRSPGRRYKSGTSREGGHVRDLLSGFNVRTFQMLAERGRREWMRAVLDAATPIQGNVVPPGWTKLDTGMADLWNAVKRLRRWHSPVDPTTGNPKFPETEQRLTDDGSPEYKAFFGEAARLRGRQLMLPSALVDQLVRRYTAQVEHGMLYRLGAWAVRNSARLFLAHPVTYVANVLTNDLFTLEAATRRILSGVAGGNPEDLRLARELFVAEAWKWFPGLRGLVDPQFRDTVAEVLPDNLFADQTALADVKVRMDEDPLSYLRKGEIGAAALQAIRYGNIDVRSKQRMAYAFLKARAVTRAREAGLKGAALRTAVETYLRNPPMSDRAQAVAMAGFELLNYSDSPAWLENFASNDYSKLVMPFPRFGYHYIAKNARRAAAVKTLLSKVPARQRADAFADVMTFLMWPAGGLGILAAYLARGDKDDDDAEARQLVGTAVVKDLDADGNVTSKVLPRELITSNRINLSAWARQMGLGTEREEDFWLRVRSYPAIAMAGAALLAEEDARKFGAVEGARTYARAASDLASDFLSVGAAVKVPAKLLGELSNRPRERTLVDPYASGVPTVAYVTDQTLDSFVPGSRQADLVIRWIDPVQRRRTASKQQGFEPGVWDAARVGHVTGLLDRLLTGAPGEHGPAESTLPPEGPLDRRTRSVSPQVASDLQRLLELGGFNVRPIDRRRYETALEKFAQ